MTELIGEKFCTCGWVPWSISARERRPRLCLLSSLLTPNPT